MRAASNPMGTMRIISRLAIITGWRAYRLIEFDHDRKNFNNFMQVAFLLEDLFERRVELVTPKALSPYIGKHILGEVEYVPLNGDLFPACAIS